MGSETRILKKQEIGPSRIGSFIQAINQVDKFRRFHITNLDAKVVEIKRKIHWEMRMPLMKRKKRPMFGYNF